LPQVRALKILQYIAGILIIIAVPMIITYCLFTRCLKRRPDPVTGKFRWVCRRSVARCKCWNRRPREVKEIKQAAPSPQEFDAESSTDQNSRRKPLKEDQKLKNHNADNIPVKATFKKNG